jgi:uncharacterized RDD family membrane protein YckC
MILHEVITTEKVPFSYRVAGIGSRFIAWLFDAQMIMLLVFAGLMFTSTLDRFRPGLGSAVFLIWNFVLMWGYFLLFEWLWLGQTPGKRVLGIRVIRTEGTSISFFHAAARNLVRVVDSLPWWLMIVPGYGISFCIMACNPKQRRLGDWAAGTLVVHVERKAKPIQAVHEGGAEASGVSEALVRQRLGQLSREQKQTLLDLCLRRDQLRISDRAQLFHALAEYFQRQMDLAPEKHQSDEKFVVGLAAMASRGA